MRRCLQLVLFCMLISALPIASIALLADAQDTAAVKAVSGQTSDSVDEVEEVEVVEEVSPTGAHGNAQKPDGLLYSLRNFHPVVVHFPIAWLLLLLLVETVVLLFPMVGLEKWSPALLVITLLSFIPALASGFGMEAAHESATGSFHELMESHESFAIATACTLAAAFVLRLAARGKSWHRARFGYYILVLSAAVLVTLTGHFGGQMVWGEDFLPIPF